jgi:hypothetical protein
LLRLPLRVREKFIGDEKEIDVLCPMCGTKTKGKGKRKTKRSEQGAVSSWDSGLARGRCGGFRAFFWQKRGNKRPKMGKNMREKEVKSRGPRQIRRRGGGVCRGCIEVGSG